MAIQQTVLLVGGTGRTGQHVVRQLMERGIDVRAIVRSGGKLAPEVVGKPNLTVIEASLLELSDEQMQRHLHGCDAVISCLGHVINLKGIFGPPRDLVTQATSRLCRAIEALRPAAPIKFILMSSVSVNRAAGLDARRGAGERAFLRVLCKLIPPTADSQYAADFLQEQVGAKNPFVQWVAVRPDTLLAGEMSEYNVHEGLVDGLFAPGSTNMANVAHFMCELVASPQTWADWKGKLPVIVNTPAASATAAKPT